MDKETRLGRFNKWGYKNSFSKGELARELTYMNRDYDKLEQQVKKQKKVIDKAIRTLEIQIEVIKEQPSDNDLNDNMEIRQREMVINLLKGVSK